jgi:hypothetical protein
MGRLPKDCGQSKVHQMIFGSGGLIGVSIPLMVVDPIDR